MPVGNKKCCGLPLKTVCLILGYINLVAVVTLNILFIAQMVMQVLYYVNEKPAMRSTVLPIVLPNTIVNQILCLIAFAFAIVLLVGLHQNKSGLVKASLLYYLTFLVYNTVSFINALTIYITVHMNNERNKIVNVTIACTVWTFIMMVLHVLLLLVVKIMYYQMKEKSRRGPAILTAD